MEDLFGDDDSDFEDTSVYANKSDVVTSKDSRSLGLNSRLDELLAQQMLVSLLANHVKPHTKINSEGEAVIDLPVSGSESAIATFTPFFKSQSNSNFIAKTTDHESHHKGNVDDKKLCTSSVHTKNVSNKVLILYSTSNFGDSVPPNETLHSLEHFTQKLFRAGFGYVDRQQLDLLLMDAMRGKHDCYDAVVFVSFISPGTADLLPINRSIRSVLDACIFEKSPMAPLLVAGGRIFCFLIDYEGIVVDKAVDFYRELFDEYYWTGFCHQSKVLSPHQGKGCEVLLVELSAKKRAVVCNETAANTWTSFAHDQSVERQLLEQISVPISCAERDHRTICETNKKRIVDILKEHGLCIVPGLLPPDEVIKWGNAAISDMRDLIKLLKENKNIDLLHPEKNQTFINNFYELSMREALRCDIRNVPHLNALNNSHLDTKAGIRFHPALLDTLHKAMNPKPADNLERGDWGRWNFEGNEVYNIFI